jgi:dihydroorotase
MARSTRRAFLGQLGAAAVVIPGFSSPPWGPIGAPAVATGKDPALGATYDLLIAGGRVIDPGQGLSAVRDVAILHGRIARIDEAIPPEQARQVFDATNKIVTPGLIDLHSHVYEHGTPLGVNSDVVGNQSGVTTIVDAGTTGASMFPGFRKFVIDGARTRIYALLNISTAGCCTDEIYLDPRLISARAVLRIIETNRDLIVGLKVHVRGKHEDLAHDISVMTTARDIADQTGLPIMMHWSTEPELLAILKAGDILTHPFNPPSENTSNVFGSQLTQADEVLPQIVALGDRGIFTDGQLATTHHQWEVSEKATGQGWFPDIISTDVARTPDRTPASVLLPMSQFLHLGLSLEQVIERVTTTPAQVFDYPEKVGSLEPGSPADVAVLELESGTFTFGDGSRPEAHTRELSQQFVNVATVRDGVFVKGGITTRS